MPQPSPIIHELPTTRLTMVFGLATQGLPAQGLPAVSGEVSYLEYSAARIAGRLGES